MLKFYSVGLVVLLVAIFANGFASQVRVLSWYEFLNLLLRDRDALRSACKWYDLVWLLLVYPLILGMGAVGGGQLYSWATPALDRLLGQLLRR